MAAAAVALGAAAPAQALTCPAESTPAVAGNGAEFCVPTVTGEFPVAESPSSARAAPRSPAGLPQLSAATGEGTHRHRLPRHHTCHRHA